MLGMDEVVWEEGLAGTLCIPEGSGPFPAVLALGGSDGGTPRYFPDLLVPEGFACFALKYWGTRDTQMALVEIPLERVERGLRWLVSHPRIVAKDGRVALVGASRGAELALLAAAAYPDLVGPVVAYTPSSVAWVGIDTSSPRGTVRSSWTLRGRPLPFVTFPSGATPAQSERGLSLLPMCEAALGDSVAVQSASIEIERATGPILLISGGDDRVWPAGRMSEQLMQRMTERGRANDARHRHFSNAGHMLFPYSRPADTLVPAAPFDLGGTPAADAAAHSAVWSEVVGTLVG
jgi:acetyl esterase/lipase